MWETKWVWRVRFKNLWSLKRPSFIKHVLFHRVTAFVYSPLRFFSALLCITGFDEVTASLSLRSAVSVLVPPLCLLPTVLFGQPLIWFHACGHPISSRLNKINDSPLTQQEENFYTVGQRQSAFKQRKSGCKKRRHGTAHTGWQEPRCVWVTEQPFCPD